MKWLSALAFVALALGLAAAQDPKDKKDNEKKDPPADAAKKLLGKWEVTQAESETPVGTVVEFLKDGKLTVTTKVDGKELKIDGTYKVEKETVKVSLAFEGEKHDETMAIKKLTDDALELVDEKKKLDTLKKVDAGKKKK